MFVLTEFLVHKPNQFSSNMAKCRRSSTNVVPLDVQKRSKAISILESTIPNNFDANERKSMENELIKFTFLLLLLATRAKTREIMIQSYSQCKVNIGRNNRLEKLLLVQRTAKITARRATLAISSYVAPSEAGQSSVLFKRVAAKPFANRRQSVGNRMTSDKSGEKASSIENRTETTDATQSTPNDVSTDQIEEPTNNMALDEPIDSSVEIRIEIVHPTLSTSNAVLNDEIERPTANMALDESNLAEPNNICDTGANKENIAPQNLSDVLLPFLPPVEVRSDMCVNSLSLLDTSMPESGNLPIPIAPIQIERDLMWDDDEILDCAVPESCVLPVPITPNQQGGNVKRAIPGLIPLCDLNGSSLKKYGPAQKIWPRRSSLTAQFMLGVLDKYELEKQTVPAADISTSQGIEDSDDSFGQLLYSDISSKSESDNDSVTDLE